MLLHAPVLDLVKVVQVPLENNEVSSFISVHVNLLFLVLLQGVHHFVEVARLQEEPVVFRSHLGLY